MDTLRDEFAHPPLSFRSAPFWSWNDRLQPSELARQCRDMKAHGMGGFFMHSREGLETEYMSAEWMACVRETVRVAKETGMGAWIYDEDRWPSGFAGGLVPSQGDAYRAKVVTMCECGDAPQEMGDVLAMFAVTLQDGVILSARRLRPAKATPKRGETLLCFRREIAPANEWFNGDTYADNLNPDAVAAFIETTYEAYRREVGAEFGKTVPGVFTDEPSIESVHISVAKRHLPWTDGLPAYFKERRGYDLLDILPWLFFDGERAAKARHDYWYTVSQRFTEAYSKQLGEWCERNDLAFTGHYLCENDMGLGIRTTGAVMPHYRYQHVPGVDMIAEQTHETLTLKQCSSAANQFGRSRAMSELYAAAGWEFSFEGQKWVGDWHYVLGVNLRCQHLALYSLRGCRKRDYPPSFNYNTTWWQHNKVVEDYFARLGRALTEGQAVRDVLLLHPVTSGWAQLAEGEASKNAVNEYGWRFNEFLKGLLATHYDCDLGDEQIMAGDARVAEGCLWVGQAPYRVVVIPPDMRTLLPTTLELLQSFLLAGGKVIAVRPLPTMIAAEPNAQLEAFFAQPGVTVLADAGGLQAALEAQLPRRVSLRDVRGYEAPALLYMQRVDERGRRICFVVNNDRHNGYSVNVKLEGRGRLEEWDALTGEARALPARQQDGFLSFGAELPPAGSHLYVIDPEGEPVEERPAGPPAVRDEGFIGPSCPFTRTDPNVLTLDSCQYRLGNGSWSDTMDVWRAQNKVRETLGMRPIYYNGLPQRYQWALAPHAKDGAPLELRFSFQVREAPAGPVYLLVEGAQQFAIELNGAPVANTVVGWYLDRAFHKVLLPGLAVGQNSLVLRCAYTNAMELEDCFLLGDFAVAPDRTIGREPAALHFGGWTSQGYVHYAGSMIYHGSYHYDPQGGGRVLLRLGERRAVHVAVHVNGQLAGHIPWEAANGLDITDLLATGVNNVDLEVVGSPRNMLGPLHQAAGRQGWIGWDSFRRSGASYAPADVVEPWGLYGQVAVRCVIRDP